VRPSPIASAHMRATPTTFMGMPCAVWRRIGRLVAPPVSEVGLEFDLAGPQVAEPELRTRLWSAGAVSTPRQRLIGTAHHHGVPVTLSVS